MKPWPYPRLMAHRAGGTVAPENTLAGIRMGASLGFRAVEIDVRFSRDDVPVLQHDAAIDRNTNGKGLLAEKDWVELAGVDAGIWRGEAYRGEPMARLADAAALLKALHVVPHVEIKRVRGREREIGGRVADEVALHWQGAAEVPLLISFSAEALEGARDRQPGLQRGFIAESPWDEDIGVLERLDAASLHLEHPLITPELANVLHERGRRLVAWTVNDVVRAEALLAMGVDGIVTDNIREFAARFPKLL